MNHWKRSAEMFEESRRFLAGGVSSSLRAVMKPVPLFAEKAAGSRVTDVDGNQYVDYIMAYGPVILGHGHPAVAEAIARQAAIGVTYGLQHRGEIELAQLLVEHVPCADLVTYTNTGSEAVQVALRLARAYTGRTKIVRFEGHYHGWSDGIFTAFPLAGAQATSGSVPGTAGQSTSALRDLLVIPWNDESALRNLFETQGDEIAAVIMEPVLCNSGCIVPRPGYLEAARALTERYGSLLIFDEVITGFRLALGGAQEKLGVVPDLVTLGKALGGGLTLSAIGGRRAIMDLISTGHVTHMGTFNGNSLCVAAGIAAIQELAKAGGSAYRHMESIAATLADGLKAIAREVGVDLHINRAGPVFHTMFTDQPEVSDFAAFQRRDGAMFDKFVRTMMAEGVLIRPSGLWYTCTAHTEEDVRVTLQAAERALIACKEEMSR